MTDNKVNQKEASAGRDIAGRDIYNNYNVNIIKNEQVRELVARLDREIASDETRDQWIDSLQFFEEPYAPDGVVGLEAKLNAANLSDRYLLALRQKELFVKFLTKYSLYGAAQELLALCLHHVHQEFELHIHPVCGTTPTPELDEIISDRVVRTVLGEYGFGTFALNHGLVSGMIYWLAERCYVRWHQ